jgi:hypothetical protein
MFGKNAVYTVRCGSERSELNLYVISSIYWQGITKYTVIYGVYIRLWPTLPICYHTNIDTHMHTHTQTHTHMRTHAHTHTHTHTYTGTQVRRPYSIRTERGEKGSQLSGTMADQLSLSAQKVCVPVCACVRTCVCVV